MNLQPASDLASVSPGLPHVVSCTRRFDWNNDTDASFYLEILFKNVIKKEYCNQKSTVFFLATFSEALCLNTPSQLTAELLCRQQECLNPSFTFQMFVSPVWMCWSGELVYPEHPYPVMQLERMFSMVPFLCRMWSWWKVVQERSSLMCTPRKFGASHSLHCSTANGQWAAGGCGLSGCWKQSPQSC